MQNGVFTVVKTDASSAARRGVLRTRHGVIETPIFMPVGTQATVKGLTPTQIRGTGAQIILGNTYHLHLRPGEALIAGQGGLHRFMGWDGPILTDSGGFQVFSLAKLRRITEEGIHFKSHLDGSAFFLGPREAMAIQAQLGSDIAMVLDECPPWPADRDLVGPAVERTVRWASQQRQMVAESGFLAAGHHVFGIVQGGMHEDLRRECALALAELDFPGYAIGGVSVGEPEPEMMAQVAATAPFLPEAKPRYVMGVGTPSQLLQMIALGVDMFDCVMPTRAARHGTAYTPDGPVQVKNARFRDDPRPLVPELDCEATAFSRAYLRHLVVSGELLGGTLLSIHNLAFYLDLMRQARTHLEAGDFLPWSKAWITRYEARARE